MKRSIVLHGQQVSYELTRKPVKYVNIRVRADGSVSVSAGEWVSEGQIEAILQARALFLLRALEKFSAQADRRPVPLSYRTGELLYLLGKRYVLVLEQGEKNTVCQKETQIVLTVKEPENAALRKRVMEAFLKALCLSGDVFPLRCHSAIYGAFGSSYAGNPSSFHDIPLGELYAGRPAGYLCPAVGGGAADLY